MKTVDELTAEDIGNLKHMLGAGEDNPRKSCGYRNYYAAGSQEQIASMERLKDAGLVRGPYIRNYHYYHATEAGCKRAGLSKTRIEYALRG